MTSVDEVYGSFHDGVQDLFSENDLHGVIDKIEKINENLKLLEERREDVATYFYAGVFFSIESKRLSDQNFTIRDKNIFRKNSSNRACIGKVVCDDDLRSYVLDSINDEESHDKIDEYFERLNSEGILKVLEGYIKYSEKVEVQDVDALPKNTTLEYNAAPDDNNRFFGLQVDSDTVFDKFEFKEPNEVIKEDRLRMFIVYSDYINELVNNVLEKTEEDLEKVSSIREDLKKDYGAKLTIESL